MDDPDADQDEDGGIEQVEAHAEGAWAAVEAAGTLIDLRRAAAGPRLAEATLDLISDRISRLVGAYEALVLHPGYRSDVGGVGCCAALSPAGSVSSFSAH